MTNLEALKSMCNAICSTFYPDESTMQLMLINNDIKPTDNMTPKDTALLKVAIQLVNGYVESSRSEGGVTTSNFEKAVQRNIAYWCKQCGLDASEFTTQVIVQNGSKRW